MRLSLARSGRNANHALVGLSTEGMHARASLSRPLWLYKQAGLGAWGSQAPAAAPALGTLERMGQWAGCGAIGTGQPKGHGAGSFLHTKRSAGLGNRGEGELVRMQVGADHSRVS